MRASIACEQIRLSRGGLALSAVIFVVALTGGCAAQRTVVENSGGATRAVATDRAFVTLSPGGPPVLSVIQSDYANATRQTIALTSQGGTPGENQLRVDVFGLRNNNVSAERSLPDLPLSEAELSAEGQEALPAVPLRLSLSYLQNRYGPFGYLVGKTAQGDTCIYAWQRLATPDRKISLINSRNAISIRLRLCDPRASEAALASTMMNLNVNVALSSGSWMPEPKQLSSAIGAAGEPIAPSQIASAAAGPFPPSPPPGATPSGARHAKHAPELAPSATSIVQPSTPAGIIVPSPSLAPLNAPETAATPPAGPIVPPPPQP